MVVVLPKVESCNWTPHKGKKVIKMICIQWKVWLEKFSCQQGRQYGNVSFLTWDLGRKKQMNKQNEMLYLEML